MMSPKQFDCCVAVSSGRSAEAAKLVLVEGMTVKQAMQISGLAESSIRNAMVRIRKRDQQIRAAYLTDER